MPAEASKPSLTNADKVRGLYDAHGEKLRYLVVGVWNTVFSYLLFLLGIRLFASPLEAATRLDPKIVAIIIQCAAWVLAVVQSTVTMKYIAFRSKGNLRKQIARAYVIYLPAQGLSMVILWVAMLVLTPGLGSRYAAMVGQLFAVFVTTIFSYFGHKYFTFRVPLEVGAVIPEEMLDSDTE
ncbi:MAG: GtrA family protein [Coriobacteriia bacterium]|nr:GtrA family protein [Coriobacteriia bacterium]